MTVSHPKSRGQIVEALAKEARTLELRREGMTFQQIADTAGWSNKSVAKRAYDRALSRLVLEPATKERDRLMAIDLALLEVWLPKALAGEPQAARIVTRVRTQMALLTGANAPINVRHIVSDDTKQQILTLATRLGVNVTPIRPELEAATGTTDE